MQGYNGWKNRSTWNVALWINNDPQWYECARGFMVDYTGVNAYVDFVDAYGLISTPDGYLYSDAALDTKALNQMMKDL